MISAQGFLVKFNLMFKILGCSGIFEQSAHKLKSSQIFIKGIKIFQPKIQKR